MSRQLRVVGQNIPRVDALGKVTGKTKYTVDLRLPGMLYGEILRCPYPHARVVRLNIDRAKTMPGVKAVVTPEDAPQVVYSSAGSMPSNLIIEDERVLTTHARYIGDRIAAVAAETPEQAEAAIRSIEVEYQILPVVLDVKAAAREDAPAIHDGGNLVMHLPAEVGNVEKGLQESELTFQGTYFTQIVQHIPMERTACLCSWDPEGTLHVWSTTQVPFHDRRILAQIFNIPISKVRAHKMYIGGGFGSRQHLHQQPIAALLSLKTGYPVKMEYNREDDICASVTRHAVVHELTTGVNEKGKIHAFYNKALVDTGGYSAHGPIIIRASASKMPYAIPNYIYDGHCYYTNNPVAGAFRGYGNAQSTFAREVHFDEIAVQLGIDPIEFRLRNHARTGDINSAGRKKGWILESCGIEECAKKAAEQSGWYLRRNQPQDPEFYLRRGMGMAFVMHGTGASFNDYSSAEVLINEDGSANLLVGPVEIGQGSDTVLRQICAEELGVDFAEVNIHSSDTAFTPVDMGSYASRVTFVVGNAVRRASAIARAKLLEHGAQMLDAGVDQVDMADKRCFLKTDPEKGFSHRQIAWDAYYGPKRKSLTGNASYMAENAPPPFGVQIAEVEVDTETGFVKVEQIVAAYDVGKAINPKLVEGQIEGGVIQGLGYALMENLVRDSRTKKLTNCNLLEYKMPSIMELPKIKTVIVEDGAASAPFGAKSIGEASILGTAPAIVNAIYDALGIRIRSLPVTPNVILDHLNNLAK
ncbi:MAG: molybdopterin cofactor-binding domain-containing protein [Dehalobacterium sp.]